MIERFDSIVLTLQPYRFGTRARKAARLLAKHSRVGYISLSKAGRTGRWGHAGVSEEDNIRVTQVRVGRIRLEPTLANVVKNLSLTYLPALLRLGLETIRSPASVVFANGPAMLPLALMHNIRYSSDIVLDVPERPGMVTVSGSAASLFSKFERALLKISRPFVAATLVVTYADVDYMKSLGFESVRLVRNVPMSDWKAPYLPPPIAGQGDDNRKLRLIAMGSVFEGRAYEKLIKAVAIASAQIEIELTVCGPGRPGYLTDLRSLADDLRIGDRVNFIEPVSIEKVSAMYLSADIGMVLYESTDPGNDGLSNKLFECVASGRPVIASDLPENHRFVEENGAGWLAGDSVEDLARVIVSAAEPDSVQSKASHCRRIGDEVLSWETEFPLQFFNGREAPARAAGA